MEGTLSQGKQYQCEYLRERFQLVRLCSDCVHDWLLVLNELFVRHVQQALARWMLI